MAEGKTIRIQASIDQSSFDAARRKVLDLVNAVNQLVQVSQKVNLNFGGRGGGGGGFGVAVGGAGLGTSATPSAINNAARTINQAGGNAGISQVANQASVTAAALTQTAQSVQQAFQAMNASLTQALQKAQSQVQNFVNTMKQMNGQMPNFGQMNVGGPYAYAPNAGGGNTMMGLPQVTPPGGGGGGVPTPPAPAPGGGGGGGSINPLSILKGLGLPITTMGAAKMLHGTLTEGRTNDSIGNAEFMNQQRFFGMDRVAEIGSTYRSQALSIRKGDAARAFAFMKARDTQAQQEIMGGQFMMDQKRMLALKNPDSWGSALATGNLWKYAKSDMSRAANRMVSGVSEAAAWATGGSPGQNTLTYDPYAGDQQNLGTNSMQRAKIVAEQGLPLEQMRETMKVAQRLYEADPNFNQRMNAKYSGALGEIATMRAAGLRGGVVKRPDGTLSDQAEEFEAGANTHGYTGSDRVAMRQQLMGVAANFRGRVSDISMLSAAAGGFSMAPQMVGLGAEFNGGTAKAGMGFFGGLQKMIGSGGVDVTAAQRLMGVGGGLMQAGNFNGGGTGVMSSLMAAGYDGVPGGSDARGARLAQEGAGGLAEIMGGGLDPLQRALNWSSAMKNGANLGFGGRKKLAEMDVASLMEAMQGKGLPKGLSDRGITKDMVQNQFKSLTSTALSRYVGRGDTSAAGQAAQQFLQAGGSFDFLKNKSRKEKLAFASTFAKSMADSTGMSDDKAEGVVRNMMAIGGVLTAPKGHGAHSSASMKTMAGAAAQDQADEHRATGTELASDEVNGGAKNVMRNLSKIGRSMDSAGAQAQAAAAGDASAAVEGVSKALQAFVSSLNRIVGASAPPGSAPGQNFSRARPPAPGR